jgi:acyl-coenzyme A synthetase/AMP-(fatty) acid ligase
MAGKAFVPIGTDLPLARQRFIIDHAGIKLCLDKDTFREATSCPTATTIASCGPHTLAYMIYSSGTTGTPKGILVGHAGLSNLAKCQQKAFDVDSNSRYLFFLSVNFDASISDILVTLTSGATLVIEPMPQEELALKLFDVVEKRGVTHTDIPPSLLKMLEPERCPACLQTIVIGGEPADIATVRRWSALSPLGGAGGGFRLVNVYGPTEATVCTSMCQCDAEWDAPLLGDVLDATHYHIYADGRLDASDGELWISGIGLALGYYKDEELTRRKFPVIDGVRYYRTSDHVRKDDRQRIVFVGRMDRQVKFHGQLIELEEIENRLRTNRHVRTVAVVKRSIDAETGKEAIVAFVQLVDDSLSQVDVERQLRQCCKHHLPRWMMPSFFEFIERMPLTPSGKTDLQALSAVALSKTVNEACCQYSSKEEEAIARVMSDILKLPTMSPDDDFLLCGGDSLDTIILISRLQQMGIVVTSEQLRQASTPRLLAQKVLPKPCRRLPPRPSGRLRGGELRSGWRGLGSEALRDSQESALSSHNSSMCIHSSQLESQWQYPTSPPPSVAQETSHLSPRSSCSVNCGTAAVPIPPQFFASKATKFERSVGLFLVTGATGFLGSHLLSELLGRGQRVQCLVRCSSAASGLERVTDTFRRFGLDPHLLQGIGIIAGDITLPRLGLSADDYRQLSEKVTDVVHCAAIVNMLANYDVLKETNVNGTRRVLDFCMTGRRKKLHYASTLSVFVATDRNSGTVFESDELNVPTNIYGGYGQTKFVAEKMAMGISPAYCDKFIYRFGLLCGDTVSGL